MPSTLPVLFFGDLFRADIASVGLNPSDREYLDASGSLLAGDGQRFATLRSLGVGDRASLSEKQCDEAIKRMQDYFDHGKPIYRWFDSLARVISGFGASFEDRTAAHLDLVQESTQPTWSALKKCERAEHDRLLQEDLPFLEWQIRAFPLHTIICNGATPSEQVQRRIKVAVLECGRLARTEWWVGTAEVADRQVNSAGWNIPLARPTGLGREGESELGRLLAEKLSLRRAART